MDDLVLESQNGLPIKFISHCTDVLCTSKTLAKYIRKYNDNAPVLAHTKVNFSLLFSGILSNDSTSIKV